MRTPVDPMEIEKKSVSFISRPRKTEELYFLTLNKATRDFLLLRFYTAFYLLRDATSANVPIYVSFHHLLILRSLLIPLDQTKEYSRPWKKSSCCLFYFISIYYKWHSTRSEALFAIALLSNCNRGGTITRRAENCSQFASTSKDAKLVARRTQHPCERVICTGAGTAAGTLCRLKIWYPCVVLSRCTEGREFSRVPLVINPWDPVKFTRVPSRCIAVTFPHKLRSLDLPGKIEITSLTLSKFKRLEISENLTNL